MLQAVLDGGHHHTTKAIAASCDTPLEVEQPESSIGLAAEVGISYISGALMPCSLSEDAKAERLIMDQALLKELTNDLPVGKERNKYAIANFNASHQERVQ